MSDLEPCPACRRHVRTDEAACPFCAAALPAHPPRRFLPGPFTRAAVFAGASLATTACGGKTKPADAPLENAAADAGADEPDPTPPDAEPYVQPMKMPYGAPPLRIV